jgi:ribose-phosphate pyrophosphokinase
MLWKRRRDATKPEQLFRGRSHRLTRRRATALMIFSGRSNPGLAASIAKRLGLELGDVQLETFANGEAYCRYRESVRDADVFLVQSSSAPVNPANDHVLELLLMINAARLASAARISAVLPLFPYARQDKKSAPREPISARLLAGLLESAGADRVLTMDLHVGQIEGFFGIPVDHMTALPAFARYFQAMGLRGEHAVVVSPDLGRVKAARRLARMLDTDLAVVAKERPGHELAVAAELIGDVRGKRALILDDMVVTGRTLAASADALHAAGAAEVRVCATHAAVTSEGLETLARSSLAEIVVTDTVALDRVQLPTNVTVLGVSDLLAETIRAVFEGRSVSAIFAGQNEPF